MRAADHGTFREWLDLQLDGVLSPVEAAELRSHLAGCADCRAEEGSLRRLQAALETSRIPVQRDFRRRVLAALPAAGWEARYPGSWKLALALLASLGGAAAALLGWSAARLEPAAPVLAALLAVLELFRASLVAGAGLLGATWRGAGLALRDALSGSPLEIAVFAVAIACLDLFLLRLLRRRAPTVAGEGGEELRLGARGDSVDGRER